MSKMSNRNFTFLVLGVVGLFFVAVVAFNNQMFPWQRGPAVAEGDTDSAEDNEAVREDKPPGPGYVKVGGVWRKKTELGTPVVPNANLKEGSIRSAGQSPTVKVDANPQVASIAKAIENKSNPERITIFKSATPFDKADFEKNPDKYLNTIEPSRAMSPAQPGPDVTPLRRNSAGFVRLLQGESTTFEVMAEKLAFISFHTTDLGSFSNGIKTINIRADEDGIAQATYTASAGTVGNVKVLAASPYNSELAEFVVNVRLPEPIARVEK